MLPALRGLTEQEVGEWDPSTWPDLTAEEEAVLDRYLRSGNKYAYIDEQRQGRWPYYGTAWGRVRSLRISRQNPAAAWVAVVVDVDGVFAREVVEQQVARWKTAAPNWWEQSYADLPDLWSGRRTPRQFPRLPPPHWVEHSLGRGVHLIWLLPRAITVDGNAHLTRCLQLWAEAFGLQERAWAPDPRAHQASQYYATGRRRWRVHTISLPLSLCFFFWEQGLLRAATAGAELELPEIEDWEALAEEIRRRWPGRWQGEVRPGARGVRFWDPAADNPTAAVLHPRGVFCFTGPKPFVSWIELLGPAYFQQRRELSFTCLESIYFDGSTYWYQVQSDWVPADKETIKLHLRSLGFSSRLTKRGGEEGQLSPLERALQWIHSNNRIASAGPFVCRPPGIVQINGRRVLNICQLSPVRPAEQYPAECAQPTDSFPFLWDLIQYFFRVCPDWDLSQRPHPREYFLAWLQQSYRSLLSYTRTLGQVVYLVGPRNNGKTLLAERVLQPLLGGEAFDPTLYLSGESNFQDRMFFCYLLIINDKDGPKEDILRKRMLARLKELTVNPRHTWNRKYVPEGTVEWTGRIVITCNEDPGSLGLLPEQTPSITDKIMIFGTAPRPSPWPSIQETEARIAQELPYFARWLLEDYRPDPRVLSADRFGVLSYIDPEIQARIAAHDFERTIWEVLIRWQQLDQYWQKPSVQRWTGSLLDLYRIVTDELFSAGALRTLSAARLNEYLISLAQSRKPWIRYRFTAHGIRFTIYRIPVESTPTTSEPAV